MTDRNPDEPVELAAQLLELALEVRAGSDSAEARLLALVYSAPSLRPRLVRRISGLLPSHLDYEDVAASVFSKVVSAIRREALPSAADDVIPWLIRVFVNAAIDLRRLRRNAGMRALPDEESGELVVPSAPAGQAGVAETREAVQQLESCLDNLPPRQQEAMLLLMAEARYNEIAEELGIALGTVGVTLRNARMKLSSCMDENGFAVAGGV